MLIPISEADVDSNTDADHYDCYIVIIIDIIDFNVDAAFFKVDKLNYFFTQFFDHNQDGVIDVSWILEKIDKSNNQH